ncbi:MAG: NAD(P)-dependent oxidoreductase [Rhodospirillales bacterium]|nr:NAD(P)-dependent oxidoreductase [Rhodospirillales bacterium]
MTMAAVSGQTIGFIGLGLMGRPMAINLHRAGARMVVSNRSRAVVDDLAAMGMEAAATPADVAARADTIILMLPDTPAVEAVLLGADGVVSALRPGSLIIDMGTTMMTETRRFAERVAAAGGSYVDAPVSGGTIGAESGALIVMAGGSDDAFARALPIFEVLGRRTTHVGPVGMGQVAKAANQVIVGLNIGAVAEALTLAKRAGADPARVREALKDGFADSRILEVHGQRMVDDTFTPGGKCVTQRKDMSQALELAASLGFDLPATRLNRDLYDKVIAAGHGNLDHAALIKVFET